MGTQQRIEQLRVILSTWRLFAPLAEATELAQIANSLLTQLEQANARIAQLESDQKSSPVVDVPDRHKSIVDLCTKRDFEGLDSLLEHSRVVELEARLAELAHSLDPPPRFEEPRPEVEEPNRNPLLEALYHSNFDEAWILLREGASLFSNDISPDNLRELILDTYYTCVEEKNFTKLDLVLPFFVGRCGEFFHTKLIDEAFAREDRPALDVMQKYGILTNRIMKRFSGHIERAQKLHKELLL
jgi:hypothetical protein